MPKITNQWTNIVEKVSRIFEDDLQKLPFELREDLTELEVLLDSSIHNSSNGESDRDLILFSQLSNYFESGFLLKKQGSQWVTQSVFVRGQTLIVSKNGALKTTLPELKFNEIRIGNAGHFLANLKLNIDDPLRKLTALLAQPYPEMALVLMTRTAEPWLKIKAEKLNSFLIRFYGDESCNLTI